jgi:putative sigma-54 modulation protein
VDVTISGRNVDINDDVKEAVRLKIGSLDRFVNGLDRAAVVFREEKNPRIAEREQLEATLEGHGHHIRCKVSGIDQMQAVDLAVVKLEKQLRKLKTQVVKRHRPNLHREESHHPLAKVPSIDSDVEDDDIADEEIPAADLVAHEIVKRKSFELMEMTPDAAAIRMQLLDHSFFLFRNVETGRSAVVYTREDHTLGVIDEA